MNILENFYVQQYFQNGTMIKEQQPGEENILLKIIKPTAQHTHVHISTPTNTT